MILLGMFFHFTGWGIAVPVLGGLIIAAVEKVVNIWAHDPKYWDQNSWPKTLAGGLCALTFWLIDLSIVRRDLANAEAQRIPYKRSDHSFFFIPIRYWAYIAVAGSLLV
jgi:hypothetical protein